MILCELYTINTRQESGLKIDYRHKVYHIAGRPLRTGRPFLLMGMGEEAGHSEESKDALIQAIEEKAGHLEYRAGREGMYDELEGLLPDKDYHAVLSIIDHGYALLEDEPITNQIAREVWDFSQHLCNLAEAKYKELAERYPEWFNESIKLQVKVTHPLSHSPFEGRSQEGKNTVIRQLSDYLRPYFVTKIGIAKMIAQIFLYFYGRDYPEVDPKEICEII